MNKLVFLGTLLLSSTAAAQTRDDSAEPDPQRPRYHLTPSFGATSILDHVAPTVGVRGLWGMGQGTFAMGLGLSALRFERDGSGRYRGEQSLVYGGMVLEWTLLRHARFHPVFDVTFGPGTFTWATGSRFVGVIEPSVGIEIDLTRFTRVGLAGVARLGVVEDRHTLLSNALSGVGGRISLSMGRFD